MDAEIAHAAFQEQSADRIRHAADPDLKTGAILHLGGDAPRDQAIDVARRRVRQFRCREIIAVDEVVDFAHVDAVAVPWQ